MKKIMAIIAMLVLVLSGCAQNTNDEVKEKNSLKIEEKSQKEETDDYSFDVTYPVISGFEDKGLETSINSEVEGLTYEMALEIAQMAKEDKVAFAEDGFTLPAYSFNAGYEMKRNTSDFLSFEIDSYAYTGGAHGSPMTVSFNVDLSSNTEVELDDLFKDPEKAKAYIVSSIQSQMEEESKKPDSDPEKKVYFDDSEVSLEYVEFSVTESGIEIYFQPYAIAPYASGMPRFDFSFEEISKFLKDNYKNL